MEDNLLIVRKKYEVFIFKVSSNNRNLKFKKCVLSLTYNNTKV